MKKEIEQQGQKQILLRAVLRESSISIDLIDGAVIDGGYYHYIKLLESNHEKNGRKVKSGSDVIVIDSIDGAEHSRSNKSVKSIISFSSTLFTPDCILNKDVTAGSSLNILAWQQIQAVENVPTMSASTQQYFQQKTDLKTCDDLNNSNYTFYDLHNGKMLYLLTQHCSWSRKHHPFILCKCKRGEGVINNNNHICNIITDEEQLTLYQKSEKRYLKKQDQSGNYSKKDHSDWVDKYNFGYTHFGIHPNHLPRSSHRFDIFHLKCSITRKLMSYLRVLLLNQDPEINDDNCSSVLSKFWNQYHLWVCKNKKNFSSFMGYELALFTAQHQHFQTFKMLWVYRKLCSSS